MGTFEPLIINITELGFSSWLALYEHLIVHNLHEKERVSLTWPAPVPSVLDDTDSRDVQVKRDDVTFLLETIRSEAFRELYQSLPVKASLEILLEMVSDLHAPKKQKEPLTEFLTKVPTRLP